ncbi:uncharacterized protein IL334_002034 [Kwoniella shivajii]|uniref:Uncharacterized protein n=1 Tax=Kwoniella shivajii TaxID=564305 RepID=A0ABZ1CTK0_9TREE|nr:hypothetical protein IL334_002034 [Kwoniella shivajii]
MDASHLAHLLRRSRSRSFAAGPGHVNIEARAPNDSGLALEKKAVGEYGHVSSEASSATRTVGQAVGVTSTQRQAAQAATLGTTRSTVEAKETLTKTSAVSNSAKATLAPANSSKSTVASSSSTTPSTSSTPSSTSTSIPTSTSTSSSTTPSTSLKPSTTSTSTRTSTSSTPTTARTSTSTIPSTTSTIHSSALPSSTLTAAKTSSSSSGMSTGGIIGAVLGAIVGLVVIGSLAGWLYRKYTARSYSTKSPWSKIDDDITPFPPPHEKYSDQPADDIYGGAPASVIGSRRALALARDNAFNSDGSLRPDSEMFERGNNHAGFGAGAASYGAYPQLSPSYGYDAQGRPYNTQAGATHMTYGYENQYSPEGYYDMSPTDPRQLVGPNAQYAMPTPVPMGRPAAPNTAAEFALAEDFADEPLTPGLAYTADEPRTPTSQMASAPRMEGRSRVCMTPQAPRIMCPTESLIVHDTVPAPPLAPPPLAASSSTALASSHIPLPSFAPLSPLMSDFDFKRQSQPMRMYEDERSTQKRMFQEVATTAGIDEPTTPYSAGPSPDPQAGLNESTTSTTSSFSAPQGSTSTSSSRSMPRLPEMTLAPPEPYIHGQPLSPLDEVPTPLSTGDTLLNPFDLPLPSRSAPPYSASTSGATGFPSPAYPPPSPGGMSVPGSVTDSPRWAGHGTPKGRAVSVYEEEDAYGGI